MMGLTFRFVLATSDCLPSGELALRPQKQFRLPLKFILPAVDNIYTAVTEDQDALNQPHNDGTVKNLYVLIPAKFLYLSKSLIGAIDLLLHFPPNGVGLFLRLGAAIRITLF